MSVEKQPKGGDDPKVPPLFEIIVSVARLAFVNSALVAAHVDLQERLWRAHEMQAWVVALLSTIETEVADRAKSLRPQMGEDHRLIHEHEKLTMDLQTAALGDLKIEGLGDGKALEVSQACLTHAETIEKRLDERFSQVNEVMTEVARVTGSTRIPTEQPRLLVRRRWIAYLERLLSGYRLEDLKP